MSEVRLRDIIERLGGELIGDPETQIESIEPLEAATPTAISFLANPLYAKQLAASSAACVIVAPPFRDAAAARGATIVSADPYLYFARLTQWWAERTQPRPAPAIHASAVVDPAARVGARVALGAFAVVEAGAVIGDDGERADGDVGTEPRLRIDRGARVDAAALGRTSAFGPPLRQAGEVEIGVGSNDRGAASHCGIAHRRRDDHAGSLRAGQLGAVTRVREERDRADAGCLERLDPRDAGRRVADQLAA